MRSIARWILGDELIKAKKDYDKALDESIKAGQRLIDSQERAIQVQEAILENGNELLKIFRRSAENLEKRMELLDR